ncbi:NUDIX hydrolase [Pseudohongiella nitratireducens]|uniref:NUDIX hydrolase n=1 Tax=Pseudohongiella nitratireducens TaxID=1768907 RepID=UPI00240921F3|nr:NUDIX hydrolase [Pseudohongiella nitratireducens]MDF1622821.1 NUDIX hydrolase [Pseudohongiella nitratireducens]
MASNRTWFPHSTVAVIVEHPEDSTLPADDRRFLMVEEMEGDVRVLNQPAGHMEDEETILQAAVREALEETGWEVAPTGLIGIYQLEISKQADPALPTVERKTYIRFAFVAKAVAHHPDMALDEDILRADWFTLKEINAAPHLRSPIVKQAILDYLDGAAYPLSLLRTCKWSQHF